MKVQIKSLKLLPKLDQKRVYTQKSVTSEKYVYLYSRCLVEVPSS